MKLRLKILIPVILTIILVLGANAYVNIKGMKQDYYESIELRAIALAQDIVNRIKTFTIYYADKDYVNENIAGLLKSLSTICIQLYELNKDKNITHFSVINADGVIAAHSDKKLWGTLIRSPLMRSYLDKHETASFYDESIYHTLIPVFRSNNIYICSIDIGFSKKSVDEKIWQIVIRSVVFFVLFLVLSFLLISMLMHFIVEKPLTRLVQLTLKISEGDFPESFHKKEIQRKDEIGTLSFAFNNMTVHLRELIAGLEKEITERRLAEDALRESEKKFRTISSSAQDAIIIMDNDGNISFWNHAAERIFGYTRSEILGKESHTILVLGRFRDAYYNGLKKFRTTGQGPVVGKTVEMTAVRKDGNKFPAELSIAAVKIKGEWNAIGILRDITDRKQAEEELKTHRDQLEELVAARTAELEGQAIELNKAKEAAEAADRIKSEFLARMSHEIRTPMNAITGLTNLTLDTELTPLQNDYLSKVRDSSRHLLRIINDILDFSKIEAGKLELEHADFMLHHVIEKMANMFRVKAAEKRIELFYIIDSHVPLALKGDPFRLGQVLINLISNAVKFTDMGEIIIKVEPNKHSAEPPPGPDQVDLCFCVQDSGMGIPPDQQGTLFAPFVQLDGSMTRKHQGSGLGLSICHRLVNLMGGRIWLKSEVGHGSSFYFNLILDRRSEQGPYRLTSPPDIRGMKVLVVDDSETARHILGRMLRGFQLQVTVARSAPQGLAELERAAARKPYDLLIVDWKMPEMDGFEMAAHIRNHPVLGAKTISPKIIMITMYGRDEILQMRNGNAAAIDGYLLKPISSSELFNTIMEVYGQVAAMVPRIPQELQPLEAIGVEGLRGARILVVEDHKINQQVAVAILKRVGVAAEVAENGRAAVDLFKAAADSTKPVFDAVLMDIEMPIMDGYEASRCIREIEFNVQDSRFKVQDESSDLSTHRSAISDHRIPIIAMTAHALKGDREACMAAGMNDFIAKPVDERELYAALAKWIKPGYREITGPFVSAKMTEVRWDDIPKEIPGIDLKTALARVNADTGLYKKMLLGFLERFDSAGHLMGQYLHEGKLEAAYQLAHALKGVSGNIGANGIFQSARDLCKVLKTEKREQLQPALESFLQQFSNVINALKGLSLEKQQLALSANQIVAVDPETAGTILRDLLELLEKRNSRAMNAFQSIKMALQESRFHDRLKRLDRAIYSLDYKTSISIVSELIQELET